MAPIERTFSQLFERGLLVAGNQGFRRKRKMDERSLCAQNRSDLGEQFDVDHDHQECHETLRMRQVPRFRLYWSDADRLRQQTARRIEQTMRDGRIVPIQSEGTIGERQVEIRHRA